MSEELREQFDKWIVYELGSKRYEIPEKDIKNAWFGFRSCAKMKEVEIAKLKELNGSLGIDYFAAKALMATIETSHTYFEVGDTLEQDVLTVAQMAYMYADAMMKARNDS